MIAPGSHLSPASYRPENPTPCRSGIAQPARGVGAVASLYLTDEETDDHADAIASKWTGITGLPVAPAPEMLRVLVEHTLRKARETLAARPDKDF
ncbi:hypothetical protein PMI02_04914 [Novosphingobium sp. AP12]|nr:hypothetical protein PMI02_04914 [Novosphingobium sp. AP12]